MKRHFILIALTAFAAVSASAELKRVNCIVCGKDSKYIDLYQAGWEYHQSSGGNGYVCPKADCRKQALQWSIADEKRARESASKMLNAIKNSKELEKAVHAICRKEKETLLATRGQPDRQIKFMKKLVALCVSKKCNAEDIWIVFAAYADIDAVKYFWPDPADEKVYLASKKQLERNVRKKAIADKKSREKTLRALAGDADAGAEMFSPLFGGSSIKPSAKTGPCALAIGRTKKDNTIRFVESEDFAARIVAAALNNDRKDVVAYLLKQTGGTDESFRREIVDKWMTSAGDAEYARIRIGERLAAAEKSKKEADDKFDIAKLDKEIDFLKKQLEIMTPVAISVDTSAAVLSDMTPSEAAEYFYKAAHWTARGNEGAEAFQEILEAQTKSSAAAEVAVLSNGNAQKVYSAMLGGDKVRVGLAAVRKALNEVCAKSQGELGKWYKWRAELNKNWRAGVADKWMPALVSGEKVDIWTWKEGVMSDAHHGKVSGREEFSWHFEPVIPSASHPGYLSESERQGNVKWCWIPGTPDVTRIGYFAGEKEGTFVWKAGIPDPERIGMVTGAREGEWVLAPGFEKQADGKVRWVAGLTDPARPGIVSTDKMFYWIPDDKHLWSGSPRDDKHIGTQRVHLDRARLIEAMKKLSAEKRKQILGNEKLKYQFLERIKYGNSKVFLDRSQHDDAVIYFDADDYDRLFKMLNDNLDVVEEHKILHPAAEKALEGNNRYR